MTKHRADRQEAIREIIRRSSVKTQGELVKELRKLGLRCTQATISRDITDMGLRKLPEGIYVLSEDLHLQHMVSEFVTNVDRANNLVVIKCMPGTAPGVAAAIDAATLEDVVGSVAGNDTVLVISASDDSAGELVSFLQNLRASRK